MVLDVVAAPEFVVLAACNYLYGAVHFQVLVEELHHISHSCWCWMWLLPLKLLCSLLLLLATAWRCALSGAC